MKTSEFAQDMDYSERLFELERLSESVKSTRDEAMYADSTLESLHDEVQCLLASIYECAESDAGDMPSIVEPLLSEDNSNTIASALDDVRILCKEAIAYVMCLCEEESELEERQANYAYMRDCTMC